MSRPYNPNQLTSSVRLTYHCYAGRKVGLFRRLLRWLRRVG